MTAFTQTIADVTGVFAGAQTSYWGLNWGQFKWGEGTFPLVFNVAHAVANTESATSAETFNIAVEVDNTEAMTASPALAPQTTIANAQSSAGAVDNVEVTDPQGYLTVFPFGGVTNGVDRYYPSWAAVAIDTETWASGPTSSVTWSSG